MASQSRDESKCCTDAIICIVALYYELSSKLSWSKNLDQPRIARKSQTVKGLEMCLRVVIESSSHYASCLLTLMFTFERWVLVCRSAHAEKLLSLPRRILYYSVLALLMASLPMIHYLQLLCFEVQTDLDNREES